MMKLGLLFPVFLVFGLQLAVHDSVPAQNTGISPEWSVATSLTYPIARIWKRSCGRHITRKL